MMACGVSAVQTGCAADPTRSVLEIIADTDSIASMPKATAARRLESRLPFLEFAPPRFTVRSAASIDETLHPTVP